MRVIKALLRVVGIKLKVEDTGTCVVCGHGACPTLGVPLATLDGTWKHMICMTVGRQLAVTADESSKPGAAPPASLPAQDRQRPPALITVRSQLGAGSWN